MPALQLSGQVVSYEVRRSTRARRARLIVHPWDGVEVVLPSRAAASEADRLVRTHQAWLLARLAERPVAPEPVRNGSQIRWRGEVVTLRVRFGRRAARLEDGELEISASDPTDPVVIVAALERAARAEVRRLLEREVAEAAAALNVYPTSLAVRDPRTRWGSCSSRGQLSFSWRLVLAPPEVLRYVAIHEVCHLVEPNHQPAFWALVDRLMPDWRAHRLWLRRHGSTLRF
ncbi:MAG TPA: SprT family zinc-dependent metalloprotease [Gaiellales bacterium]